MAVFAVGYVITMQAQFTLTKNPRLALSDFFLPFLGLTVLAYWGWRRLAHLPLLFHLMGLAAVTSMGVVVHYFRYGDMPRDILVSKGLGVLIVLGSAVVLAGAAVKNPFRLVWATVGSVVVICFLSIIDFFLDYVAGVTSPFDYDLNFGRRLYRLTGLFQDPNAYGGILVMALLLNLCLTTLPPRPDRRFRDARPFLQYMSTVILLAGIFLTFSRTAWIGAVMGLVTAVVLRPKMVGKRLGYAFLALVPAAGLAFLIPAFANLASFLTDRPRPIEARLDQLNNGLAWVGERPFLGSGLGSYLRENDQVIHNTLFSALVEMGIVGFAVFAWFFGSCIWYSYRASRELSGRDAQLGVATASALMGLVGVSFGVDLIYQRYLWFAIALSMICALRLQQKVHARPHALGSTAPRPLDDWEEGSTIGHEAPRPTGPSRAAAGPARP